MAESPDVHPKGAGRQVLIATAVWFGTSLLAIGPLVRWQTGTLASGWGRPSGRAGRDGDPTLVLPVTPEAHTDEECVADLEAVLAATCPEPAVLMACAAMVCGGRCGSPPTTLSGWRASSPSRWGCPASPRPTRPGTGSSSTRCSTATTAGLITMEGAGHMLPARHPVKINLLIKDFVDHLVKPQERHRTA